MVLNYFNALMDAGLELEKLRADFFYRMIVLTLANLQGMEARSLRLKSLCGKPPLPPYPSLSGAQGVTQLADAQAKYLENCGDAYIKEARNLVQAAFLTQSELMDWTDRMLVGWSKLAPEVNPPGRTLAAAR
jgi:hypothetical protein